MRISDWSSDVCSSDLLRGVELLSVLLQLRRRSADRMNVAVHHAGGHIEGFEVPIHGSLGAPLLLGGAPRGLAIVNGTLAAASGLGLQQWISAIVVWAGGHTLAVVAGRRDSAFAPVPLPPLRQRRPLSIR